MNASGDQLNLHGVWMGNTNSDFVQAFAGVTRLNGCTLFGSGGNAVGIHIKSGGQAVTCGGAHFKYLAYCFKFDAGNGGALVSSDTMIDSTNSNVTAGTANFLPATHLSS